jgi:hypothetical protein
MEIRSPDLRIVLGDQLKPKCARTGMTNAYLHKINECLLPGVAVEPCYGFNWGDYRQQLVCQSHATLGMFLCAMLSQERSPRHPINTCRFECIQQLPAYET